MYMYCFLSLAMRLVMPAPLGVLDLRMSPRVLLDDVSLRLSTASSVVDHLSALAGASRNVTHLWSYGIARSISWNLNGDYAGCL